jgi:hypothetical protein
MRSAIRSRTLSLCRRLNSGSVIGATADSTVSVATELRMASYSRVPIATRSAGCSTPAARSTAGRMQRSMTWRVRSELGPRSIS